MKIAILAPSAIPARRANTLQVMKMTQALADLGHVVRLAVPDETSKPGPSTQLVNRGWEELRRHYGLHRQFPIEWLPAHPRLRRYDFSLRGVRWAQHWGADLLYTRLPQAAALASLRGQKTIFEAHDLPQGVFGPWMARLFFKGKGAYRFVLITHSLAVDLAEKLNLPLNAPLVIIAPDGVDLERYANLPAPSMARTILAQKKPANLPRILQPEDFIAGYTGHLYPGRGRQLLLSVAECLPEVVFLISGGEPQEVAQLQSEASARKLENILLTGFVPNADLPLYQAACDILLMPYQRRVAASSGGDIARYLSPMKLFEYLACGRAILSSDLPVLQEVLNTENAILLPCDDVNAWAGAIQNLQSDPQRRSRLGEKALHDASLYSWEARAAKIIGETIS